MKLAIITHVPHSEKNGDYFAYTPYVREMNIWLRYADEIVIAAPLVTFSENLIDIAYEHPHIKLLPVKHFNLLTLIGILNAIFKLPGIALQIFRAMRQADHIHLRCPGNVGLVGCFVQMLFPKTPKTAKYAGNWDPYAKQPWSYRLQKWLLSNTFLTKNMQVLVYGKWEGSSRNIKPFFTASYKESEKTEVSKRDLGGTISMVFAGTLSPGKRPLYAVKIAENLYKQGIDIKLSLYGDGKERESIQNYIRQRNLEDCVSLKGNQTPENIKAAFQKSHFVILPSQSEGWPKVVAEGMFWGCLPITTKISCLGYMLGEETRGIFIKLNLEADTEKLLSLLKNPTEYQLKVSRGMEWSRKYTLDLFENEIKGLLNP